MGYPIVQVTVGASTSADEKRLEAVLAVIAGQNPTVNIHTQPVGSSHSIEAQGRSQLERICELIRDEYHLAINIGPIRAALLETIRDAVQAEGKYFRQVVGLGNYGHCILLIEPNNFGEGHTFASAVGEDTLPREFIDSIKRGAQQSIQLCVSSGRHLIDLKVTTIGGSYHAEDSNPTAFEVAGALAFQDALRKSSTVLLEPLMAVEIDVPENLVRAIKSQIQEHRGRIEQIDAENGWCAIRAIVPLAELLLPESQELADFPAEFVGYAPVSDNGNTDENGPGVTVNRPDSPRYRSGSVAARPTPEEG